MYSKKRQKQKRKTRRGGFFNIKKTKSEEDNIKDWYKYWRKSHPNYSNTTRYPGYYNSGLYPEPGRIPQQSINWSEWCNSTDQQLLRLCAVNLTGENRKAYDRDWSTRDGNRYVYTPSTNWVEKLNM